jgi:hypothetical protein
MGEWPLSTTWSVLADFHRWWPFLFAFLARSDHSGSTPLKEFAMLRRVVNGIEVPFTFLGVKMRLLRWTLPPLALLLCIAPADATPITYTDTVTGTGALGAAPFTNALVTISLTGETSTVFGDPVPRDFGSATVNVFGVGTATFTDPLMWAIDNPGVMGGLAGIADVTAGFFLVGTENAAFALYNLRSSIGPISGTVLFNPGVLFPTTLGNFALTSVAGNTSTFTAFTAVTSAVAEPASVILGSTGLLGIVRSRVRRHRRLKPSAFLN